jgi:Ca2+-transporting ATPase
VATVVRELAVDPAAGLSGAEAARRLAANGPNELAESSRRAIWQMIAEQFSSLMVIILLVAAVISALLGDVTDTIVIAIIVVLNAGLGFVQEYRAERALAALKQLAVPIVRARRAGQVVEIPARNLVVGDIVLLETGNRIPADGRLIVGANLRTQEASLTGESLPIDKQTAALAASSVALGDRVNMVFLGTHVANGRAEMAVTATGMNTELGAIAAMLQSVTQEQTPLQRRLDSLGRMLAAVALGLVVIIFVLGLLRGEDLTLMFLTAVSMAVAAVPEGLPAVVTIALALGAQRMLKQNALIRTLAAVETLGSVTVICSDKTGTLTENRMTVTVVDVASQRFASLPDSGLAAHPAAALLLAGSALCNDVQIDGADLNHLLGDPTESALVAAAAASGLDKSQLDQLLPRVAEVPFDSERKCMTTVHSVAAHVLPTLPAPLATALQRVLQADAAAYIGFSKGAVDRLLEQSDTVWFEDQPAPLTASWCERITQANDQLAKEGMRVLGVAMRPLPAAALPATNLESELIFIGLVGMIDPPRPEARTAVQTCLSAGIRPVMITGDHPLTASAIALDLGFPAASRILTGAEIAQRTAEELQGLVADTAIFARVAPEHKLAIIQAFQRNGQIVAMTGDGVNDAPALKQADIGVAMGLNGTDVAKESANMVLQDDNFATIVAAVREGRVIYDNIRKFIKFMLATNTGELWVMLLAPIFGMPLPLLPLQLLWINLVTDGLPALALSMEPAEQDLMQRPPRPPSEHIFARGLAWHVIWVGFLMGALTIGGGYVFWRAHNPAWQTLVFTTLTFVQMANVLAIRSEHASLFQIGIGSNPALLAAVTLTVGLQLAVVYLPFLQTIFRTTALSPGELGLSLAISLVVFGAVEIEKWLARRAKGARQ